jgi:hypothetical protein
VKQELQHIIRKLTDWKDFVFANTFLESQHTLHTFANRTNPPSTQNLQKSAILSNSKKYSYER